jgi:hypothetical protein
MNCFDKDPYSGYHWFMIHYFGIDMVEVGDRDVRVGRSKRKGWKRYGMKLLGTSEFREYCRRNVDFWRDERNLL